MARKQGKNAPMMIARLNWPEIAEIIVCIARWGRANQTCFYSSSSEIGSLTSSVRFVVNIKHLRHAVSIFLLNRECGLPRSLPAKHTINAKQNFCSCLANPQCKFVVSKSAFRSFLCLATRADKNVRAPIRSASQQISLLASPTSCSLASFPCPAPDVPLKWLYEIQTDNPDGA